MQEVGKRLLPAFAKCAKQFDMPDWSFPLILKEIYDQISIDLEVHFIVERKRYP